MIPKLGIKSADFRTLKKNKAMSEIQHEELAKLLPEYMHKNTIIIGEIFKRIEDIAKLVRKRQVRFLCGAGMSRGSSIKLFSTLASEMAREIVPGVKDFEEKDFERILYSYPPEAIAQAYIDDYGSSSLKNMLRESFGRLDAKTNEGHKVLQYLVNNGYIDRVYTTNFDDLIEKAFNGAGEGHTVSITDDDVDRIDCVINQRQIPVIHLHGTINSQCLITERETYTFNTKLAHILMADMIQNGFVLIGYSMKDTDLRSLYFSLRDLLKPKGLAKRTYAVLPLELDKEWEWVVADKVWGGRGIKIIPMKAEEFLPYLRRRIELQRSDEIIPQLKKKMGVDERELNEKIEQLEKLGMSRDQAIRTLAIKTNL